MEKKPLPILLEDEDLLPIYSSELASGADVRAANRDEIVIAPSESALIPTGIRFEIPPGYEIQVRPRSGLAFKHQVTVLNTPGTIDADYRGEFKVILINHGKEKFVVEEDRILEVLKQLEGAAEEPSVRKDMLSKYTNELETSVPLIVSSLRNYLDITARIYEKLSREALNYAGTLYVEVGSTVETKISSGLFSAYNIKLCAVAFILSLFIAAAIIYIRSTVSHAVKTGE